MYLDVAIRKIVLSIAGIFLLSSISSAQNLKEFEKNVTEFTLENGLKFIVVERHEAPVVTFTTYANVGSVDEVTGITGLAHVFEHMAFKGTSTVGTKNIEKERESMKKVDEAFDALRQERDKEQLADPKRVQELEAAFETVKKDAQEWANSEEFTEAIERAGGVGVNAGTDSDSTQYLYSLPSNKAELFFTLESDRFMDPVLREFYVEKDVVMEERRLRTDSQPVGRLVEEFLAAAYKAHPYGEPTVGHMSDLESITRAEAEAFFHTYYVPNNLTIVIVGDVQPDQMQKFAETYFNRIPRATAPPIVETIEPPQKADKRITIEELAQPYVLIGYHIGSALDPDNLVFSVIADIASRGRASRMYKSLVKEKKIALAAFGFPGFPGTKYPNLFGFFGVPTQGHTAEEVEQAIYAEIERLKTEPVSDQELQKAKTRARADLIRSLDSNTGIAQTLAYYQAITGDWRNLFRELDQLQQITAQDVQKIANETFTHSNRTVGIIRTAAPPQPAQTN